jgi:aminopeptidase-like protein
MTDGPAQTDGSAQTDDLGAELMSLLRELYPICRSITGDGLRQTLAILGRQVPLQLSEVATGTPVLDWEVPREWNIRDQERARRARRRLSGFESARRQLQRAHCRQILAG